LIQQRILASAGIRPIRHPIPPLFVALMLPPLAAAAWPTRQIEARPIRKTPPPHLNHAASARFHKLGETSLAPRTAARPAAPRGTCGVGQLVGSPTRVTKRHARQGVLLIRLG